MSHVLNSTATISAPVRERVHAAAIALNYRPNALARSLISGRTQTVGLIVSDITNPYYGEVLLALERRLSRTGLAVLLCNADYDLERVRTFVHSLVGRRVDAVVIGLGHGTPELAAELALHGIPAVVHWHEAPLPGTHVVTLDFEPGMRQLAAYLTDLGHRRFALLTGPSGLETSALRRDVFLAALAGCGVSPAQVQCVPAGFRLDGARRAMQALLKERRNDLPTAVIAGNDLTAFGAMQALREAGLRVPQDMSVVGTDDVAIARSMNPPLTTLRTFAVRSGIITARLLLDLLQDTRLHASQQITLATRLVVRGSTAEPPDGARIHVPC